MVAATNIKALLAAQLSVACRVLVDDRILIPVDWIHGDIRGSGGLRRFKSALWLNKPIPKHFWTNYAR